MDYGLYSLVVIIKISKWMGKSYMIFYSLYVIKNLFNNPLLNLNVLSTFCDVSWENSWSEFKGMTVIKWNYKKRGRGVIEMIIIIVIIIKRLGLLSFGIYFTQWWEDGFMRTHMKGLCFCEKNWERL